MSHYLIQCSQIQMRKLRRREIKWLVQSHMPSLMQGQSWNPGFLAIRGVFFLYHLAACGTWALSQMGLCWRLSEVPS